MIRLISSLLAANVAVFVLAPSSAVVLEAMANCTGGCEYLSHIDADPNDPPSAYSGCGQIQIDSAFWSGVVNGCTDGPGCDEEECVHRFPKTRGYVWEGGGGACEDVIGGRYLWELPWDIHYSNPQNEGDYELEPGTPGLWVAPYVNQIEILMEGCELTEDDAAVLKVKVEPPETMAYFEIIELWAAEAKCVDNPAH